MSPKEIHPSVKISVACSCRAAFGVDLVSYNTNLSLLGLKFWCEVSAKIVIDVIVFRVLLWFNNRGVGLCSSFPSVNPEEHWAKRR